MSKILEKLEDYMTVSIFDPTPEISYVSDDELFGRMADFIISIDPEILTDEQLEMAMGILDDLEILTDEEEEEIDKSVQETAKRANKTLASKKTYGRQWYRKNKTKVKTQKEKMKKSAEGRKRSNAKSRLLRGNKTPTGRPVRRYNTQGHTNV